MKNCKIDVKVFSILILLLLVLANIKLLHAQRAENKSGFGLKIGVALPVGGPRHTKSPYISFGAEYRTIWPSGLDFVINGELLIEPGFYGDGLASLTGMVHYHIPGSFVYSGIGISRYVILTYDVYRTFALPIDIGILYKKFNFNIKYTYVPLVDEGDPYNTNLWNYSQINFTVGWWFIKKSTIE